MDKYENCQLCPRNCGIDRSKKTGYCGCSSTLKAARAGLHMYEEPFLSGQRGSGTVFFSGCSMKCVFCQNIELSRDALGFEISTDRLSEIFLEQQERGAHNINLVTGTHYTPSIAEALIMAKNKGLSIPVLWNSSGYEKPETLEMLDGLVDIWMPDLKTFSPELGEKYFRAPDYPKRVKEAIAFMVEHSRLAFIGKDSKMVDPEGEIQEEEAVLMTGGVNVRHLCMPGALEDTKKILKYLHETYGNRIWISLMNQYTPMGEMPYKELNRKLTTYEYNKAVDYALELGIEQCMIQEGGTVSESFIPAFDGSGII